MLNGIIESLKAVVLDVTPAAEVVVGQFVERQVLYAWAAFIVTFVWLCVTVVGVLYGFCEEWDHPLAVLPVIFGLCFGTIAFTIGMGYVGDVVAPYAHILGL